MALEALDRAYQDIKGKVRHIRTKSPETPVAPSKGSSLGTNESTVVNGIKSDYFVANERDHIRLIARRIRQGEIVAFPFNGVFGLFGDIDYPRAVDLIHEAKRRPPDKKLVAIYLPERLTEVCDFSEIKYSRRQVSDLQNNLHALGVILPASTRAPYHLVDQSREHPTILSIWTEYSPLRQLLIEVRRLGARGLVGTSANLHGDKTHWRFGELARDFDGAVHMLVEDDFNQLPEIRRRSTSIIDLTGPAPRLHREGNVSEEEIRAALFRYKFGELTIGRDVIVVKPRQ